MLPLFRHTWPSASSSNGRKLTCCLLVSGAHSDIFIYRALRLFTEIWGLYNPSPVSPLTISSLCKFVPQQLTFGIIALTLQHQSSSCSCTCPGETSTARNDSTVRESSGSSSRNCSAPLPTFSPSVSLTPQRRLFKTWGFFIQTSTADQKPSGRFPHPPGNFKSNSFGILLTA